MDKVRVAYSSPAVGTAPVWTGVDAGYFNALDLDVEPLLIHGSSVICKAMEEGKADLANFAAPAPVHANLDRGSDFVIVIGAMRTLTQSLCGRPGITSLDQLKGGSIGIHNKADVNYWLLRCALPKIGLEEDKDVEIKLIPRAQEGNEWDHAGGADCLVLHVPVPEMAAPDGWTVLVDLMKLNIQFQLSCICGRRSWIEANRDVVKRYVRGHVEGLMRFNGDRAFALDVMRKWGSSQDDGVNAKTHDHAMELFSIRPFPTEESIQGILDAMAGVVPGAETAKAADFIDRSFIEELDADGTLDELAERYGLSE